MGLNWLWEMNIEKGVMGKGAVAAYVCVVELDKKK